MDLVVDLPKSLADMQLPEDQLENMETTNSTWRPQERDLENPIRGVVLTGHRGRKGLHA